MISCSEYIKRRGRLFDLLKVKDPTVVVYGRDPILRLPSVHYKFDQFADMLYFTGYDKPYGVLGMKKTGEKIESTLFIPERNYTEELWNGFRTSFEEAQKTSGVTYVRPITEFPEWRLRNMNNPNNVFTSSFPQVRETEKFNNLRQYADLLRVIKSRKEIELIQKACDISRKGHIKSMSTVKPGVSEAQIASRFALKCYELGATGLSYPTVCASGDNALCLHYLENNTIIKDGTCVMMDAGCEYYHYTSDFTRTVPAGKVPQIHLQLLDMVEFVKDYLVKLVKKGSVSNLYQLHGESEQMFMKELKSFGFKKMDLGLLRKFYPHGISHWIGLDVHDADTVSHSFKLQTGCVFSVEPGLYFPKNNHNVPEELRGIGCRFEDTVIMD